MLFALPFLTIVMFSNAAAFPAPAATVMAAATGLLMTGTALLIGTHQVLDNPAILVFPLALLGAVSIFGNAVGTITMRQRWAATTDQLTGPSTATRCTPAPPSSHRAPAATTSPSR